MNPVEYQFIRDKDHQWFVIANGRRLPGAYATKKEARRSVGAAKAKGRSWGDEMMRVLRLDV